MRAATLVDESAEFLITSQPITFDLEDEEEAEFKDAEAGVTEEFNMPPPPQEVEEQDVIFADVVVELEEPAKAPEEASPPPPPPLDRVLTLQTSKLELMQTAAFCTPDVEVLMHRGLPVLVVKGY